MIKNRNLLAAAVLAAGFTPSVSEAAIIYRETFSSTINNANPADVGWTSLIGSSATAPNATSSNSWRLSNNTGKPSDLANVDAGSEVTASNPTGQVETGYVYNSATNLNQPNLVFTSEYVVNRTQFDLTSFSWYLGNAASNASRLAVQIGTEWFATDTTFINSPVVSSGGSFSRPTDGTNPGASLMTFNWTAAAAQWRNLTVDPGVSLAVAGSARTDDLPSGDISAFGLYYDTRTSTQRFDTFQIAANEIAVIPETANSAVLALIFVAGFTLRRR